MVYRLCAAALAAQLLVGAPRHSVAPNVAQARIEGGVCYGICGAYAMRAMDSPGGNSQQPAENGHAAGGDHVGPCGGEWLTDFELPITQSCCQENPPTLSTGERACVCPMAVTCSGMTEWVPEEGPAAGGETILIGGDAGWVVQPGNAEYPPIAANVGDTLQFTYSSFYHDVVLVDNEECDFSSGTVVDETGDFAWTIPAPGTYIFACSRGDHCAAGNQQITVTVAGDAAVAEPEPVECLGDVTGDLLVDVNDLLQLLSAFGQSGGDLAADLDADLLVNVDDLLMLLGRFGSTC